VRGVGVDAEHVSRFEGPASPNPLPMVFGDGETAHAAASGRAAWCLCAAFCVKEALRKALGEPVDPRECAVFPDPADATGGGALRPRWEAGPGLREARAGAAVEVLLRDAGDGEWVATVVLSEIPRDGRAEAADRALVPPEVTMPRDSLTVPLTVEFEDVDAYGIAHHARIVAWLERARLRFLMARGLPVHPEGCTPVLYDLQVRYRSPARLLDRLDVTVEALAADDFTVTLGYRVRRGDEVLARARTVIAFRDAGRDAPAPVPEAFRAALSAGAGTGGDAARDEEG
jgi:acyl-CoA thioester hydrolase